jgi:lipopolysaccharide/colanic/teichoic acid biosynthesis glycosyltransferase
MPRSLDILLSLIGLLLFLPFLIIISILVKVSSRGAILFKQIRIGKNGRPFTLIKFRTMYTNNQNILVTAKNDSRITPIGKLLRYLKLDELPELINVLKGDLSLVGPRPEVPKYVDMNNQMWQRVLQIRPGLTDPVTIKFRNEESILERVKGDKERFYLDILQPYKLRGYIDYIEKKDISFDFLILFTTIKAIIIPNSYQSPELNELENVYLNRHSQKDNSE